MQEVELIKIIAMEKMNLAPFALIGITVRTVNKNGQAEKDISLLWERFLGEGVGDRIKGKISEKVYSVYLDYEGDHTKPYTVLLGCNVKGLDQVPQGMVGRFLPGGAYAVFSAVGDLAEGLVYDQWEKISRMQLPRAWAADFEVYQDGMANPSHMAVDFFVSLRA